MIKKDTKFKKGNMPWNKGMKGRHISRKTEFKKGHTPWWIKRGLENPVKNVKYTEERNNKIRQKMKGKSNPNYIHGNSRMLTTRKYGDDWNKIRQLILLRDKFTCQECGLKKRQLHIHHKIPFMVSFNNSLDNLTTLCAKCHPKVDSRIRKKLKEEVFCFANTR